MLLLLSNEFSIPYNDKEICVWICRTQSLLSKYVEIMFSPFAALALAWSNTLNLIQLQERMLMTHCSATQHLLIKKKILFFFCLISTKGRTQPYSKLNSCFHSTNNHQSRDDLLNMSVMWINFKSTIYICRQQCWLVVSYYLHSLFQ